jgi:hypothetical protein
VLRPEERLGSAMRWLRLDMVISGMGKGGREERWRLVVVDERVCVREI